MMSARLTTKQPCHIWIKISKRALGNEKPFEIGTSQWLPYLRNVVSHSDAPCSHSPLVFVPVYFVPLFYLFLFCCWFCVWIDLIFCSLHTWVFRTVALAELMDISLIQNLTRNCFPGPTLNIGTQDLQWRCLFETKYWILVISKDNPFKHLCDEKSLKIPKGYSEAVNQRRTDNTMANQKRIKGQTAIYKTWHRKLKIEQNEPG